MNDDAFSNPAKNFEEFAWGSVTRIVSLSRVFAQLSADDK
jgi:hypothetical protein